MQWCIDLFFNIIYKIVCITTHILFRYVLWFPFISFFYIYIYFKTKFFKFLGFLYFEFFVRKPIKRVTAIATFFINFLLAIFASLPRISYLLIIKWPIIRIFNSWYKVNPNMYVSLKIFFLNRQKMLLFLYKTTIAILCELYTRIKMIPINFFFHDIFQKRQSLYKHFVLFRTIFVKIILLCCVLTSEHFYFYFYLLFSVILDIDYNTWDFDSNFVFFYILISMFDYTSSCNLFSVIYAIICLKLKSQLDLLNLNELFLSFGLNFIEWDYLYLCHRTFFSEDYDDEIEIYPPAGLFYNLEQLKNFILMYICDYANIPFFFFFGFLFFSTVFISWIFFSFLGLNGLFKLNLISLAFFWFSLLFYIKPILLFNKVYNIKIANWFYIGNNTFVDFYFLIDSIAFSFILLTVTIALFVYIYAFSYFRYEPLVDRFLLFLLSFIISMLFLVSAGNLIMLFLGWELIGLTSFFLINFWVAKTATLKSAFKAFSFNKISDFFLFIFVICVYNLYFTVDISILNNLVHKTQHNFVFLNVFSINSVEFLSFFLLSSAFIKSAQIGGHIWLPDSMEAPVPASALIHSATLVSAGIYLLLRFNFLFDYSHFFKIIAPLLGSITAAYGGICAVFQTDLKKTLAYSTISHCGFLVTLCSFELNEFVILYLYVHGFFKAILFMCVGNVLRISMNYQDSRRMGGLFKYLPFEYFCSLVCVFNLAGLPFTFGFFVKHLLFLNLYEYIYLYYYVMFNLFFGAVTGLFYSYNILYSIFFDFKKGDKLLYAQLNKKKNFSFFYTNSSFGSTVSIFSLLTFSFILVFFICKFFLSANFLFSDYVNTIYNNNYYSFVILSSGFNMNFIYINFIVILISIYLIYRKKRRIMYVYTQYNLFFSSTMLAFLLLIFYY